MRVIGLVGCVALAVWLVVPCAYGQSGGAESKPTDLAVTVGLKVVAAEVYISNGVEFDSPAGTRPAAGLLTAAGVARTGTAAYDVAVRTEGLGGTPPRCRLWVDSDADGDLDEETPLVLARDESAKVDVRRKRAGGDRRSYRVELTGNERSEMITWSPLYRAEGLARVDGKDYRVWFFDLLCDGALDEHDAEKGTALGVDLDGDGQLRGARERFSISEIASLGARRFTIGTVTATQLVLEPSTVDIPVVGAPLPRFVLPAMDGSVIALSGAKERPLLVEFWASWCVPCVQMMPRVKELGRECGVELLYVSIDDKGSGVEKAREIAAKHGIGADRLVMRGMGGRDEAFRAFASIPIEREVTWSDGQKEVLKTRIGIGVPLLLLVDREGVLRYAGSGTNALEQLKKALEEALKKAPK